MATFPSGRDQSSTEDEQDRELVARVRAVLSAHLELQMHPIHITACRGVVELHGTVPSPELRHLAGQLAISAHGVREVANHITVTGDRA